MVQENYKWTDVDAVAAEQEPAEAQSKLKLLNRQHWISRRLSKVYLVAKRGFDVVSSACLLAVIWPVFVVIAVAIRIDSRGPVIYKHRRVGQYGKELYLYKFRSMVVDADDYFARFSPEQKREWEENYKLVNDPRITKVGAILRKTSLDELPQLLNILQGSLSVVGPRPVIKDELEKYGENKTKFLSVKPGLTGYWQAYARSNCTYQKRMEMELFYVDNANFWWDMRIIWDTIRAIIHRRGAM